MKKPQKKNFVESYLEALSQYVKTFTHATPNTSPCCPYCFSPHVMCHDDGYCFCNDCQAVWNRFDYEE